MRYLSILFFPPFSSTLKMYVYFQDGFYDGELVDGRRGLVPGNYIQKLVGEDLLDFHQNLLRDCDDCASTTVPQDLDFSMGHECGGIFGTCFHLVGRQSWSKSSFPRKK